MSQAGQLRLPAAERRQAIVDAALPVFARSSYGGATTAEIARAAGVSEPILYRHFASKRELYLACLEAAWGKLRAAYEQQIAELGEREAVTAIGRASIAFHAGGGVKPVVLWMQALSEAGGDPEIRDYLRRQLREVHDFVAGAIRRAQAAGGVPADRVADAEAWIFVGSALLFGFADRLGGGLLDADDLATIAAERFRWLSSSADPESARADPGSRQHP